MRMRGCGGARTGEDVAVVLVGDAELLLDARGDEAEGLGPHEVEGVAEAAEEEAGAVSLFSQLSSSEKPNEEGREGGR